MHVAGISPLDSWDYTWGEGVEVVNAYRIRENDRAKRQAVALYNASVFLVRHISRLFSGGNIDSFDQAFPGFSSAKEPMSDNDMYAVAKMLNICFGGEEG